MFKERLVVLIKVSRKKQKSLTCYNYRNSIMNS